MDTATTMSISPPKVRLTLRVGVTGHRPEGLNSSDRSELESKLDFALIEIKRIASQVNQEGRSLYASGEPVLRLISPIAEGADVLAAEAGVRCGYELQCALPFRREDYEKDFESELAIERYRHLLNQATAVFELNGSRKSKTAQDESYQAVGRMVLSQSDVLIAVWDGEQARGKGGTGQVVKEALQLDIPVVWISSEPGHEIKVITRNEDKNNTEVALVELEGLLEQLLLPKYAKDSKIRDYYFSEVQRKHTLGVIFELFCDIFSWERLDTSGVHVEDFEKKTREEWNLKDNTALPSDKSGGFESSIREQVDDKLLFHFSWADNLAKYYSNIYRSSFVANFLLAGLAVFFALLTVAAPCIGKLHVKPVWIFTEFIIIILILAIVLRGNRKRWHERWIDYRLLSEEIRQLRFLAPVGLTTPAFRLPAHDTHGDPRNTWVNWHFRGIIRELGMVGAKIDRSYLEFYRTLLSDREISGQIEYHENNYPRFHRIHEILHFIGIGLFVLTLVAVFIHLFSSSKWLTLCAAVLPAFGAAFYGIRTQGEFEQIAKRSRAMSAKLKDIKQELDSPAFNLNYREISIIAEDVAEILSSETLDWRIEFQSKRLVLPV